MGLDSAVKKLLRTETPKAFHYYRSLKELYENNLDAVIIDVNVELFKKPHHVTTGLAWATWIFENRIKNPPSKVVVLLFDSAPRVPHSKDLTHLQRSGDKRKRGFVPLPPDTLFGDHLTLPEWNRVTGSKHLLPRVWDYLIGALKKLTVQNRFYDKTVFFDKPMCPKLMGRHPNLSGDIELIWQATSMQGTASQPNHLYGEGDMKTRAWVVHLQDHYKLKDIYILSTDLDNIPIFCDPCHRGVKLLGNTVGINNGKVVTKKQAAAMMHEVIDLGRIATTLGEKQYNSFRVVLCMGMTDFGWNVHQMTTQRMLKTYFWLWHNGKVMKAKALLESPKAYMQFYKMCHSKVCGNAKNKKDLNINKSNIENYLKRTKWIFEYWCGEQQALGGPDPRDCEGYKKPNGIGQDLKEYGGKVRLIPR